MKMKAVTTAVAYLCAGAAMITTTPARANLMITPLFTDGTYSADAQKQITDAIAFYTANITGNTSIVVGFGVQTGGGASALTRNLSYDYTDYAARLRGNATESATDVSALKSLTQTAPVGNGKVQMTTTLATTLGLLQNSSARAFSSGSCGSLAINACVAFSPDFNSVGTPTAGFFGVAQHELDEVLGTSSSLDGNTSPAGPSGVNTTSAAAPADLFRYSASDVRSFNTNPGPAGCEKTQPLAYLSVDSGATNLARYNNCANGGDYGDFAVRSTKDPQVYTGDENGPSTLALTSPEVTLLDAVGYNFTAFPTVASGTPVTGTPPASAETTTMYGGPDDGIFADQTTTVPEPASMALLAVGLVSLALARARRVV